MGQKGSERQMEGVGGTDVYALLARPMYTRYDIRLVILLKTHGSCEALMYLLKLQVTSSVSFILACKVSCYYGITPFSGQVTLLCRYSMGSLPMPTQATSLAEEADAKIEEQAEKESGAKGWFTKKNKKSKKEKPPKTPTVPYFALLFRYATPMDYALMIIGSIGALIHGAGLPLFFLAFGELINALASDPTRVEKDVSKYALYMVYLGISCAISSYFEVACWMTVGERLSSRIRSLYLRSVLKQEVTYFDSFTSTGEIVGMISSDMVLVQDAVGEKVGNWLQFIAQAITGLIVGFTSFWQLALILFGCFPLIAAAGGLYAYILTGLTSKGQAAYAEAGTIAQQNISQIRTVYSFTGEEKAENRYSTALKKTLALGIKAGFTKGWGLGLTFGTLFCAWALALYMAAYFIAKGSADGGKALTTLFSVIIGALSLGQSAPGLQAFAQGKAAAYKIFQTIERTPAIDIDDPKGIKLGTVRGDIELKDVIFHYPMRKEVTIFDKFNLTISAGQTVAMVGSSGSGKSTVVALVERWYDPISGSVTLDGVDIKTLQLRFLRSCMGLVSQEPVLFGTTIRENILYGKPDATEEEVIQAAQAANAHSFITSLPDGYNTQVGERGTQLSGGQKQRVAIARAIIKNPRILLLDEATSALDSESERIVQDALDKLMVGRTTIIIAHRLSTIRYANKIAVVSEGKIVEEGTHEELLAKGDTGAYSALIRLQEMAKDKDQKALSSHSRLSSSSRDETGLGVSRRLSLQQDSALGKGTLLEAGAAADGAEDKAKAPKGGYIYRLFKLNAPEWMFGILGIIGGIAAGSVNPVFAFLLTDVLTLYQKYINSPSQMKSEVFKYSMAFLGMAVFTVLSYTLLHYSFGVMAEKLTNHVRVLMFSKLLKNEAGFFDREENSSGVLASRLASDATQVRNGVSERIGTVTQNLSLVITAFTMGLILEWRLALVIGATFPLMIAAAMGEQLLLKGFLDEDSKSHKDASKVASEAVGSIRTVAAFGAEDKISDLHDKLLIGPMASVLRRGQVAGICYGISQFFLFASMGLALWYAGVLVGKGQSTFADTMRTFMVLIFTSFAIAEVLALTPDLAKGSSAAKSVFEILDRNTEIVPDDPTAKKLPEVQGQIELRGVEFSYPTRPEIVIFRNFSLSVPRGRAVALVGASGSGKSSVLQLIERFYDPIAGSVLIDGYDIKTLNLKWLRQHIGLVQQEPALFALSIRENILYGRPDASEAEVIEAARAANAHTFISGLPNGYDTEVGEMGTQLSGGQKQRVAIARAVLKNPAILLLDEATSALDAESERIVQEALDRLMVGRTTVVVAHRLSTIRNADSIAVVQDGYIIEQGKHEDLIQKPNGAYSSLISIQQATAS